MIRGEGREIVNQNADAVSGQFGSQLQEPRDGGLRDWDPVEDLITMNKQRRRKKKQKKNQDITNNSKRGIYTACPARPLIFQHQREQILSLNQRRRDEIRRAVISDL